MRSTFVRLCGKKCFLENLRDGPECEVNYSHFNGLHVSFGRETRVGQSGTGRDKCEMRISECGIEEGCSMGMKGMISSVDPEVPVVKKILPAKTQSGKGKAVKTPLFPRGAL